MSIFTHISVTINLLPYLGTISKWEGLYKNLNWTHYRYWIANKSKFDRIMKQDKFLGAAYLNERNNFMYAPKVQVENDKVWIVENFEWTYHPYPQFKNREVKYADGIIFGINQSEPIYLDSYNTQEYTYMQGSFNNFMQVVKYYENEGITHGKLIISELYFMYLNYEFWIIFPQMFKHITIETKPIPQNYLEYMPYDYIPRKIHGFNNFIGIDENLYIHIQNLFESITDLESLTLINYKLDKVYTPVYRSISCDHKDYDNEVAKHKECIIKFIINDTHNIDQAYNALEQIVLYIENRFPAQIISKIMLNNEKIYKHALKNIKETELEYFQSDLE